MARLLVANRGEIACRIIRAARSLGLETVAVYSEADAELPHVGQADLAVCIGPANARESYLDINRLLQVAHDTGCSLVHPGYGFLSENARFARRVREAGLTFVGPEAEHIELMGDKQNARAAAIAAGVPVLPGTGRLSGDSADLVAAAERVGYPLLVKAVAGGGGHGMQLIESAAALVASVQQTRAFAARVFGDDGVYLERCLQRARHVEVQIFSFGADGAVHLFERDCSLQRRHQKVIEEAPAPGLGDAVRKRMTDAALSLVQSIGYSGAGTIEYLYDPATEGFYFLEMNTRIQVEHPVTEMITGVDLVGLQLRYSLGSHPGVLLEQDEIRVSGVAMEARVYAENPDRRFLPAPGLIEQLTLPEVPGVRYDCGYRAGNVVTAHYDPMILKVIARGQDRQDALQRLAKALRGMTLKAKATNLEFLLQLIERGDVRDGQFDTGTIERLPVEV